ncbi:hypothetical protein [Gordonia soli]|uniref:Uncharacterized protein n=1 Tax=Gordonia soli NBRC 108243 TaxID=1223545 RepID=M0QMM1_9ACTN|nr:hypothetical protein [Gordonia soli]GAC68667.1 hypothetical protein GS4_17_00530 [Gordonia soli NBRC 108243]
MAPAYRRSTRSVDLAELPPDMRLALTEHAETQHLRLADDLPAWLTRSENPPSTNRIGRLLGRRANSADPDSEHQTLVLLHPTQLIVVTSGAERGVTALSVPLAQATVAPGSALTVGGVATPDDGYSFSVTGFAGHEGRPGSFYLGMGADEAGLECRTRVRDAITAARNP